MTQLEAAGSGQITEAMRQVAEYEKLPVETVRERVANGSVVIPKNINHSFEARGIGQGLTTKVNANLGTSPSRFDINAEMVKLDTAVKAGADAVMDLSTGGDLDRVLGQILSNSPVMVGTVPIYKSVSRRAGGGPDLRGGDRGGDF